jgi:serine/threonine protein kinase/Tfp pilus assembly protein PilF
MGEVYRARDTKLGRDVALKILPEAFARDPDRLARFEREARLLASLNHPNIAQIFGFEDATGVHALAMELVEGATLDVLILRSQSSASPGLPLDQALAIAVQIADALEAAHEAGIVHRDLKPANVKVRDDGVVKVLDFGLAKSTTGTAAPGSDPSGGLVLVDSQTMTSPVMTQAGSILGTAAYMSPEQARGRAVDKRADIWAFGVLLFEMLTGRHVFAGETVSDTIAAILTREPDFAALPAAVPVHVRALLARCLERDPKRRLRDIGDARHDLQLVVPASGIVTASAASQTAVTPSAVQPYPPSIATHGHRFTWLGAAIGLALVASLVGLWQLRRRAPIDEKASTSTGTSPRSIVVLPFVNQSGNPDDEYFSDGMTDELSGALMKVPDLRVAARSSAFTFKGKNPDAREVGAKLDVATLLEGTVRRSGSKLRVTAQLVNASDGLVRWSERYERESKDVFAVQDDITAAIVSALQLTLGTAALAGNAGRTENAEAHDLYLRGRFLVLKQSEEGIRTSLDYFAKALEKDPGYAPAYAGTALAQMWLADAFVSPRDAEPKAKAAALKAIELDSTNAEAHTYLGLVQWFYDWKFENFEVEFHRALQLNPNSMEAHNFFGLALCAMRRWDEGLAEADRAMLLDPLAAAPSWTREFCLVMSRRYDQAIQQHKKTAELDPNFFYFESLLGIAYREKGTFADSVAEYQRLQRATGGPPFLGLAITYARMGKTAEARNILDEFLKRSEREYVSPDEIALIYANLGEKDQAFAWLDRAYEARSAFLITRILGCPNFDPLRSDPRFDALVRKIGLKK